MKISLVSILLFMTWLGQVQLGSVDFRYKRRGAPPPPRPPAIPQYLKKWDQHRPPRGSQRPRQPIIPMQMVSDFKPPPVVPPVLPVGPPIVVPLAAPVGPPVRPPVGPPVESHVGQSISRPVAAASTPVRTFWKYTKTPTQTVPEKAFHYSPPISNTHEFDYHIQTNSIPTHNIPIKQLGEKGPIHTIPAPNLSLADKPIIVEEVRSEPKKHLQKQPPIQTKKPASVSQYQVTEPNEVFTKNSQKHFREQQVYYGPDVFSNTPSQNYGKFQQPQVNKLSGTESFVNLQDESHFSNKELYQLLNSQLQQQQPVYEIPSLPQALVQPQHQLLLQQQQQQQQLQQIPFMDYQAMLTQSQLYQPDTSYLNQVPSQYSRESPAQFHAFTAERHAQDNYPRNEDQSTFITTDYNLKTEDSNSASFSVLQDPNKPEPYVQEIFELGEENLASGNKVESSAKDSEAENKSDEKEEEKAGSIGSGFYATLPNRQAAEALASLQAAGKVNSNLMQVLPQQRSQSIKVNQRTPLEIYVPDTHSFGNHEAQSPESLKTKTNYGSRGNNEKETVDDESSDEYDEDPSQDNESIDEHGHQARSYNSFGSRIRPKQNQ